MAECVASLSTDLPTKQRILDQTGPEIGQTSRDQTDPESGQTSLDQTDPEIGQTSLDQTDPEIGQTSRNQTSDAVADGQTRDDRSDVTAICRPPRLLPLELDGHLLEILLRDDTAPQHIEELLRVLSCSGEGDLLKLVTPAGQLLAASSVLRSPQPGAGGPLRLARVATHVCERNIKTKQEDLQLLKERLDSLETELSKTSEPVPASVIDLRTSVSHLLRHINRPELIDWLGHRPPPVVHSRCQDIMKSRYRSLAESELNDVLGKFRLIREADVSEEVRQQLRTPTFDSWQWSQEEMLLLLQQMFVDLDLTTRFSVELDTLRRFLVRVFENYNVVPFHNFRHGFCVTQMMYCLVWSCELMVRVDPLDVFILLISCICHDLDHPGYNNIYQINAGTDLALRYNDVSPLENHHCSVAFSILQEPTANMLRGLTSAEQRRAREGIIRCILATDMARHNEIIGQFREIVDEFDFAEPVHVNLLSMILIKIADISNEARPVPVADPWIDCLLQEFYNQSDREKAEGLPVTPFMDRDKVKKAASQCNFISFVLMPLLNAAVELLKELEGLVLHPAREALEHYSRLNEQPRSARPSLETNTLLMAAAAIEPLAEDTDPSEDTLNEAEVSERSAKFKIATRNDSICRRVSDDCAASPASVPPSAGVGDGTMRFSRYFRWMLSRPEEKRPSWAGPERTAGAVVGLMTADRRRPASSPHDARLLTNGRSATRAATAQLPKPGYLRSLVLKKREQSAGSRDGSS